MKLRIYEKKLNTGKASYSFDGEMSIYVVKALKKILMKKLSRFDEMEFDFSRVNRVDTAGFQLYQFIKREAEKADKRVYLKDISIEFKDIFDLYGETAYPGGYNEEGRWI